MGTKRNVAPCQLMPYVKKDVAVSLPFVISPNG